MKSTKVPLKIQNALLDNVQYRQIQPIVRALVKAGGKVLLVGGAVRDLFLSVPTKDFDIEVHQVTLEHLEQILRTFKPVSMVGKAYGVLRIHGIDIDWSVPRTEGPGRKPKVMVDPLLSIEAAFRRRDLTINAMGIDLKTFELIDPFNGQQDLKKGILRACDTVRFTEDPLRLYRVMQFIGRFALKPADSLNAICKKMDIRAVAVERKEEEFKKLFLKSHKPSLGIRWLQDIDRLHEILPELAAVVGVPQNPRWHPEGEVFEHTMQTIDAAAHLTYADDREKLLIMYAALCHDLGKAVSTEEVEGTLKSFGHAISGVALTKKLLARITRQKDFITAVCILVKYHMMPGQLAQAQAKPAAYKRLASKLAPAVTMQQLALLALADKRGRSKKRGVPLTKNFPDIDLFLSHAHKAQVLTQVEEPILHGRDVLDVIKPGPAMGRLLKKAYKIQIKEGIKDKRVLKKRVLPKKK